MKQAGADLMLVRVVDGDGRVVCSKEPDTFEGAIAMRELRNGQQVHLMLEKLGEDGISYEVHGVVRAERDKVPMRRGVTFKVDVERLHRVATSAPVSNEPFESQQTHQALHIPTPDEVLRLRSQHTQEAGFASLPSAEAASMPPAAPPTKASLFGDMPTSALFSAMGDPFEGDSEPDGIFGALSGMSLTELVQSLELNRKTARIDLRPKGHTVGTVYIDEGAVVFAEWDDLTGDDAFIDLAQHHKGRFRIRFHERVATPNIDRATPWLILEAARRTDENLRDSGMPPPLAAEHAPRPMSENGNAMISVSTSKPLLDEASSNLPFPSLDSEPDASALDDAFEVVHTRTLSVQEAQKLRERVMGLKSESSGEPVVGPNPSIFDDEEDVTDSSMQRRRQLPLVTEVSSLPEATDEADLEETVLLAQPSKGSATRAPAPQPSSDQAFDEKPTKVFSAFFDEAVKPKVRKKKKRSKKSSSSKSSKTGDVKTTRRKKKSGASSTR
mgnify:CR=1 FL=1